MWVGFLIIYTFLAGEKKIDFRRLRCCFLLFVVVVFLLLLFLD